MLLQEKVYEERVKWVGTRPLMFAEFLDLDGHENHAELVDGVVEERMAAQLDHEKLLLWLDRVLGLYVEDCSLGIVLGSRTAVEIHQFRGRLPDLLFVCQDRLAIVQQKAVFGAPDLILEVISPNDRSADIIALETDYRVIGVTEIVFIDQRKHQVRVLRRRASDYEEEVLTTGMVTLETLDGVRLETDSLFTDPRPGIRATVDALLANASSSNPAD